MAKANVLLAMVREYFTSEKQKADKRHQERCVARYDAMMKGYAEFQDESHKIKEAEISNAQKGVAKSFEGVFTKDELRSYLPGDVMDETYGPATQAKLAQLQTYAQQAQQAQIQKMQAQYHQALNAINTTAPTWLTNSTTGSGNVLGGVGVGGTHTHTGLYPGRLMPGGIATGGAAIGAVPISTGGYHHPYRSLGSGPRDTLFLALKGIEEAASKSPKGNHRYDHNAVNLLDMRNFSDKEMKVSLLGLVSFCVSNVIDPEGIIMLLRGYGLKVE